MKKGLVKIAIVLATSLLISSTISAKAQAVEVYHERTAGDKTWICNDFDLSEFKKDYKQCVVNGKWELPNLARKKNRGSSGGDSYRYACEKFTLHLNCTEKQ
jgi:hypothetical protein